MEDMSKKIEDASRKRKKKGRQPVTVALKSQTRDKIM